VIPSIKAKNDIEKIKERLNQFCINFGDKCWLGSYLMIYTRMWPVYVPKIVLINVPVKTRGTLDSLILAS
jgi:hypothetical protein